MSSIDTLTLFIVAFVFLLFQGFYAHLAARWFGKYSQFGYNWSYIISFLLFFPLGGVLISFSKNIYTGKSKPSILKTIIGYALIIFGIYSIFHSHFYTYGLRVYLEYNHKGGIGYSLGFNYLYEVILHDQFSFLFNLWRPFHHLGIIAYGYALTEISRGKVLNQLTKGTSFEIP